MEPAHCRSLGHRVARRVSPQTSTTMAALPSTALVLQTAPPRCARRPGPCHAGILPGGCAGQGRPDRAGHLGSAAPRSLLGKDDGQSGGRLLPQGTSSSAPGPGSGSTAAPPPTTTHPPLVLSAFAIVLAVAMFFGHTPASLAVDGAAVPPNTSDDGGGWWGRSPRDRVAVRVERKKQAEAQQREFARQKALFGLQERAFVEKQLAAEDARRFALESGDAVDVAAAKGEAAGRQAFERVARETWESEKAAAASRKASRAAATQREEDERHAKEKLSNEQRQQEFCRGPFDCV